MEAEEDALSVSIEPRSGDADPPSDPRPRRGDRRGASPDGTLEAFVKDHNLWIRNAAGGEESALSTDGGLTWTDQRHVPEMIEPICQATLRRHSWPETGGPGVLLFANPASTRRERLTLRASFDEGQSWPVSRLLDPRPAAYSCLAVASDGSLACLFEAGEKNPYERIVLTGIDRELVGTSAANIEHATHIRDRDPRVFQDGIYMVQRG